MHIAFFTVLSPIQSALADCSEGLAVAMASVPGVTVDLFINDNYKPDNAAFAQRFKISAYQAFEARAREYDACLYMMGDHGTYHGFMLDFIYRYPGVVILNDLTLHRCILHSAVARGDTQAYINELEYACAIKDMRFANQIQAGLGNHLILQYPLFERIVDSSLGVIVQNQYARHRILSRRPSAQVRCIPYPFFMPPGFPEFGLAEQQAQQRAAMELEDHFVVGSFGIFVPDKHLEACLSAFARVVRQHPQSRYVLGGASIPEYDLVGRIREMGLAEHVIVTGWLPPLQFVRYMFALDVGIHLRYPHIGGTPYTPIRLMGLGVSTIVSDIEPLAELPLGACAKIAPGDYQDDSLTAVLEYLADHPDFCHQLGDNGRQFIAKHHDINQIAQQYVGFIQSVARAGSVPEVLRQDLVRRGLERAQEFTNERYQEGLQKNVEVALQYAHLAPGPRPGPAQAGHPVDQVASPDHVGSSAIIPSSWPVPQADPDIMVHGDIVPSPRPIIGPLIYLVRRHSTLSLIKPYVDPMLERQVIFNAQVLQAWQRLARRLEDLSGSLQESQAAVAARLARIEQFVLPLEGKHTAFSHRALAEKVGGDPETVRWLYAPFADAFVGSTNVLDIGCGRGIFLELLQERGITAQGIDLDEDVVASCKEAGLDVVWADALDYLERVPEQSVGGMFCAHVIEHVPKPRLQRLVQLAHSRLQPGARAVFITPNAGGLTIYHATFYKDLTHQQPLHPAAVQFLLQAGGFQEVTVSTLSATPEEKRLSLLDKAALPAEMHPLAQAINADLEQLNALLYGDLDCAVSGVA